MARQLQILSAKAVEKKTKPGYYADGGGLLIKTRDAERFHRALNHIALDGIEIESIAPADDNVNSLYEYLIGGEEATR